MQLKFDLHTHFTGQLSDYRSSLIQACMTTRILRFLKRHIFFSRFRWDSATGMVIKIALCLELFRFLQFVVKQDKTSLCSSSSQLHCSRPPWLVCARDQNRHAACRSQVHPLLSQFAALGETLLRTLTKAWKYAGTEEDRDFSWVQYLAAHFVVRLSNFYTMAQKH